jgi:hypothetical protein
MRLTHTEIISVHKIQAKAEQHQRNLGLSHRPFSGFQFAFKNFFQAKMSLEKDISLLNKKVSDFGTTPTKIGSNSGIKYILF